MSHRKVLVVEDERAIADAIGARLRAEGFEVATAGNGPDAVARAAVWHPDLVVLDIMLPGFDGLEVCRRIQADRPVPIIMLTARDDENDLLVGLAVGADDYLTKPFSLRELAARVHALLRREERAAGLAVAGAPAPPAIVVGDLEINPAERRVRRAGVEIHLTPIEFDLLSHLARRPRTVLPRQRLLAQVWGWAEYIPPRGYSYSSAANSASPRGHRYPSVSSSGTRTVDSHVKALRRKLGADLIRTVHGVGYSLEVGDSPAISAVPAEARRADGAPEW